MELVNDVANNGIQHQAEQYEGIAPGEYKKNTFPPQNYLPSVSYFLISAVSFWDNSKTLHGLYFIRHDSLADGVCLCTKWKEIAPVHRDVITACQRFNKFTSLDNCDVRELKTGKRADLIRTSFAIDIASMYFR